MLQPSSERQTRHEAWQSHPSNCAAGRITGDIRVNGNPWHRATYARMSGYVEQSDIHSERPTVHESLMFSAALRMPPGVPRRLRAAFVEEVRLQ